MNCFTNYNNRLTSVQSITSFDSGIDLSHPAIGPNWSIFYNFYQYWLSKNAQHKLPGHFYGQVETLCVPA